MAVNGIRDPNFIVAGARLRIPSPVPRANDAQGVQRLIAFYAQAYGVPTAFAQAIAWQESGFNERMVSRTGAIGVMKVEPGTGVMIGNLLGHRMDLHVVGDNVQAGVFWLARLYASYGGDEQLAAAAYYQGERSLARDGMYDDTRQYVADVMALESRFGG